MTRFMAKVDDSGDCWLWTGCLDHRNLYGRFRYQGRPHQAHRIAYLLFVGEVPAELAVCHRCDVPSCVNPEHLFLGTLAENNHDMISKGRHVASRGARNGRAKLTPELAASIREQLATGVSASEVARRVGLHRETVGLVRDGKSFV